MQCLGLEIRERRLQLNLSQEKLAFGAGVHPNVIGRLERGLGNPGIKTLWKISQELHVTFGDLFTGAEVRILQGGATAT